MDVGEPSETLFGRSTPERSPAYRYGVLLHDSGGRVSTGTERPRLSLEGAFTREVVTGKSRVGTRFENKPHLYVIQFRTGDGRSTTEVSRPQSILRQVDTPGVTTTIVYCRICSIRTYREFICFRSPPVRYRAYCEGVRCVHEDEYLGPRKIEQ